MVGAIRRLIARGDKGYTYNSLDRKGTRVYNSLKKARGVHAVGALRAFCVPQEKLISVGNPKENHHLVC